MQTAPKISTDLLSFANDGGEEAVTKGSHLQDKHDLADAGLPPGIESAKQAGNQDLADILASVEGVGLKNSHQPTPSQTSPEPEIELSLGIGGGLRLGEKLMAEIEYTQLEADIGYATIGLNWMF